MTHLEGSTSDLSLDVDSFLRQNKLNTPKIIEKFKSLQINIKELFELDEQELKLLAKDFEIYIYNEKPFLSHMYSSGVYHWRTKRSSDLNYWLSLIKKVENKIGKY